ncbi:MAG: glycosyl hydrolase family 65 protein, partial [Arthrobacter sp.]|uniref:glycoside hydrolase family 65 protein n=1 Tax=Arthrobacter sp. TaxID=1667 RepID=UPI00347B6ABC
LHYPGTYLAGVYNRLESVVQDHRVELEDMVNAPNWLQFDLRLGADWWSTGGLRIVEERRELDLRRAVLSRSVLLENHAGDRLRVRQRRIVSMADRHLAALETVLTADRDVQIQVRSGTDTTVVNANVPEDALLANRHLVQLGQGTLPGGTQYTEVLTSDSAIRIAVAVRTTARDPEGDLPPTAAGNIGWTLLARLRAGIPVTVLKTAAFVTSRDSAISSPRTAALAEVARAPATFAQLATRHHAAWHRLWRLFAVHLEADPQTQLILNLHVFHLLQTITPHTADLDAGVPARGLHGEGYRGHVFWDELFVLPLVTTRLPALTRGLLGYRWRRLDAARDAARAQGLAGALFPWQCGSDGREETPDRLYNARSGRWIPDNSRRQRHVGLAVAFNAWSYAEATDDREWLLAQGADLLVEVARLFASLAEHDPRADRFHLRGVMGPDEYHDGYPGRPGAGVDDNAYTNVMAAWLFRTVARLLLPARDAEWLSVRRRLRISPGEVRAWDTLGRRMFVPFHDGTISQFAGYADLAELDWEGYRRRYGNIERLDLILEAEGDTTNRYRLSKQADVLMLVYLLGADGLRDELSRLGYDVGPDELRATVDYYLARTANGSTLSRVAHASVLAAVDPEAAWATYREALDADLDDTQGGTTRAGVHLGAMAGSIDVVQRSFAGLRMGRDGLAFAPRMPAGLRHVSFSVRYRGHLLHVGLGAGRLQLRSEPGTTPPVRVRVGARAFSLSPGGRLDVPIDDGGRGQAPPGAGPDPGAAGDAPASDPRTG